MMSVHDTFCTRSGVAQGRIKREAQRVDCIQRLQDIKGREKCTEVLRTFGHFPSFVFSLQPPGREGFWASKLA